MKQRTVQLSVRAQLHLPPLDLSLDSILYYIGVSRYTCFCSIRLHACLYTVKYPPVSSRGLNAIVKKTKTVLLPLDEATACSGH